MFEFIIIFALFLAMIALMAIGVMFKRKPIAGSCGGLGNVGIEKACDCDNPCDKRQKAMKKAALIEHTVQESTINFR